VANWAVFLDWDSVLFLKSPRFLSILLEDHKDLAWMSCTAAACSPPKVCLSPAAVGPNPESLCGDCRGTVASPHERMVYHWPHYTCHGASPASPRTCALARRELGTSL